MKLQYMFRDKTHEEDIINYKYEYEVKATKGDNKGEVTRIVSALPQITSLEDSQFWMVEFNIAGNSMEAARHLSKIHIDILKYEPIVLLNEASEYYSQKLFPLFNEFEMRLRKFIYLSLGLANNDAFWKKAKDIDSQDFFTIYTRLFTSKNFNNNLKNLFQEGTFAYTKSYILNKISAIEENDVIWDSITKNKLSIIKDSFQTIKIYRNDVMHAHYITSDVFLKARRLMKNVNDQLNQEIDKIYHGSYTIEIPDEVMIKLIMVFGGLRNISDSEVLKWWTNLNEEKKQFLYKLFNDELLYNFSEEKLNENTVQTSEISG